MTRSWEETRREFCRMAAREGVYAIAEQVPADPQTIYRLIRGDTEMPTRAVRASIERLVEQHEQQKD
jgi:hypothetical protein